MRDKFQFEQALINKLCEAEDAFDSLLAKAKQILQSLADPTIYPAAVEILLQDSRVREIYFLERGLVKITHTSRDGKERIIGLRFPGTLLGAASIALQKPSIVAATTLTRCYFHKIMAADFLHLLRTSSEFTWYFQQAQSYEIFQLLNSLVQLGGYSARQRLEQLLWQLALRPNMDDSEKEARIRLPLRHADIAEIITVTPEYLSRILKHMEQEHIIRREKGWLIIPDIKRLFHSEILQRSESTII